MRSTDPSESVTVPLPDQLPSKPTNGPDWAEPADTDSISAAPIPAVLIARPNELEPNRFISSFPIQIDALFQEASRRIEDLVSPQCVRFKWQLCRCLQGCRPSPGYPQNTRSTVAGG